MPTIETLIEIADDLSQVEEFPDMQISRRSFLGWLAGTAAASAIFPAEAHAQRTRRKSRDTKQKRTTVPQRPRHYYTDYAAISVPRVSYDMNMAEPNLKAVRVADRYSETGRIQRSMRWKNITDSVSARYGVPSHYLLGMMCQESYGDPTVPNSSGDGGCGLIHMQPKLTSKYGLKMITNSRKLIDRLQGRAIRGVLAATGRDLKELVDDDERFHPVKNIDAAARMLCDLYENSSHSWSQALLRYAGRRSYPNSVLRYADLMLSPGFLNSVGRDFESRNRGFLIRGLPATFERYLDTFHTINRVNYGIQTYIGLPKHLVHLPARG